MPVTRVNQIQLPGPLYLYLLYGFCISLGRFRKLWSPPPALQIGMVETKGKMAVICHGDLWWSNVLFKYNPDTGSPVEVKFIDFQSSRVASLGKGAGSQSKGISKNIKSEIQTFCKIRDSCIWIILRVFDIFNQFSCF